MISSLFQIVIGFTGLIGILLRFIGPLTIAPTIALVGVALFHVAAEHAGKLLKNPVIVSYAGFYSLTKFFLLLCTGNHWGISMTWVFIRMTTHLILAVVVKLCVAKRQTISAYWLINNITMTTIEWFCSSFVEKLTNRMWFNVVCTPIDNDMRHHRAQNLLWTHSAGPRESTTFWPLWWSVLVVDKSTDNARPDFDLFFTTISTSKKMFFFKSAS